ncbi:hypothetical protein KY312_03910, partial [Candidatus Woesearchaeota archaeon]|nr:hypothetical protein [Candidatus Woesearchaeota archaeon]
MKKVLMIAYYYPPLIDSGAYRTLYFSENLKKFGWEPIVLTVKNPDKTYCNVGQIEAPKGIKIQRSHTINIYKLIGKTNALIYHFLKLFGIELKRNVIYDLIRFPDIFYLWTPFAYFKAKKIIKKEKIDVIYISCPFHSSAL